MNLKKKNIALILFAALVLGFIGAYAGVKITQPNASNVQQLPGQNSEKNETDQVISTPEQLQKVVQTYNLIKQHYIEDVEDEKLLEGAIQGMIGSLDDPYSTYMDPETMARFNEQIEASFEGIGAEVSMVNGKVTIVAPIKDSPAEAAGLRPNDQIMSIDGENIEGLDLHQAVEKIRGEKGSKVTLKIQRPGVTKPFDISIIRDEIPLETVHASEKDVDGNKTGIIQITSFSETTANDFATELEKLERDGMKGLVIDVRGNPGGLLKSVEEIMEHFVPKDIPYYQIEDKQGVKVPHYSHLEEKKEYPITVLIDEGSASASEILSIALKEIGYDVVGTTSYGKGTVQQAVPLGDGSTIKLTFNKWLSPKGTWIHEKGVEPTVEQKQPDYFYSHPIQLEETLKLNREGEQIKNIQQMLQGLGYDTIKVDSIFNQDMENAVKDFQQKNDLQVTGEIDEKTAGLIESQIIEKIRSKEDDKQLQKALEVLYK